VFEPSGLFTHGSRWVRADFHLHTRCDGAFADKSDDRTYLSSYVTALKQADVRVGIITNHNKFDRDEFIALRKAALKEEIFFLPGLELSVKDGANGIHALVVFQDDWIVNKEQKDYVAEFLSVAFAGQANYDKRNARSNQDLLETIRELDKFQRDYFLVFAHVEAENGLWGGLSGGRIQELGNNELFTARTAAFQKVRTKDLRGKVQGWLKDWYPAEVEGSDPKAISEIGRGEKTFIKIGAFTFEAIQFALKPGAERVALTEPDSQPHSWIQSIRFEGGILDGKRFDFSRQLNCLIGIRGSGKSAVLEALRYALELPCDETIADWKYKQDLVRFTLQSGGKVLVEVEDAQGRLCEVRRILNDRAGVYVGDQLQPGVSTQSVINKPRFFGQKELAPRGEGFERELIERLLGSQLDATRREIAAQKQRVIDVLANMDKLKDLDALEQEYQTKRKDAEFKLELFRQHGVEAQLKRQVDFNADVANARRAIEAAESFVREMEAFWDMREAGMAAYGRIESSNNADLMNPFNDIFARIRRVPEKGRQLLAETRQEVQALHAKFGELERRRDALKEEFATIERKLSAELQKQGNISVRPDDFIRLSKELQNAKLALKEITKEKARKAAMQDDVTKELKALSDLWHREFKQIEAEVKKLNDSQTALHITAEYKGDKDAFLEQLKANVRGSRLREATLEAVKQQHADFASVYASLAVLCGEMGDSGEVFRKYFNEAKSALLTWQVPNRFIIEYHGKALRDHSLGQRASAWILFILSQRDNDVIVIDQPEDDLDNQTIFEDVIKLVRVLKKDIQFIFATHNANFPVLGDAEQVGACAFATGHGDVKVGSIDDTDIQKAIVSIMEGGREAFARRKEIYHLWKQ
jgi:ABC-type cobalamin/Fe3+-siderophores transport system ATPase subunit